MRQRPQSAMTCTSESVICRSWFPLLVISVSNKPWIGPLQILGQPFGFKDDSFGLDRGHAGEQLCWFVCFDPLPSTACRLEDFPGITYTMKSRLLHSMDCDQRLLRDEVCRGPLRLLRFNYLFWRHAFWMLPPRNWVNSWDASLTFHCVKPKMVICSVENFTLNQLWRGNKEIMLFS